MYVYCLLRYKFRSNEIDHLFLYYFSPLSQIYPDLKVTAQTKTFTLLVIDSTYLNKQSAPLADICTILKFCTFTLVHHALGHIKAAHPCGFRLVTSRSYTHKSFKHTSRSRTSQTKS